MMESAVVDIQFDNLLRLSLNTTANDDFVEQTMKSIEYKYSMKNGCAYDSAEFPALHAPSTEIGEVSVRDQDSSTCLPVLEPDLPASSKTLSSQKLRSRLPRRIEPFATSTYPMSPKGFKLQGDRRWTLAGLSAVVLLVTTAMLVLVVLSNNNQRGLAEQVPAVGSEENHLRSSEIEESDEAISESDAPSTKRPTVVDRATTAGNSVAEAIPRKTVGNIANQELAGQEEAVAVFSQGVIKLPLMDIDLLPQSHFSNSLIRLFNFGRKPFAFIRN